MSWRIRSAAVNGRYGESEDSSDFVGELMIVVVEKSRQNISWRLFICRIGESGQGLAA